MNKMDPLKQNKDIKMFEIVLAEHAGFCSGVKGAYDKAISAGERHIGRRIATWGPIVHNPSIVKELEHKGIRAIENIGNIVYYDVIIYRAHGMEKPVEDVIKYQGKIIVDAVCPLVKKVCEYAVNFEEKSYNVVIIGDSEHPEIKGVVSHLKKPYNLVRTAEDIKNIRIDPCRKIGVVAQTTFNTVEYGNLVEMLKSYGNVAAPKTICSATEDRQEAARAVAKKVDYMVVIGGKNSSNTTRLVEICSEYVPTKHIESSNELSSVEMGSLYGTKKIGITAGASTPKKDIEDVIKSLKNYGYADYYLRQTLKA